VANVPAVANEVHPRIDYQTITGVEGPLVILDNVKFPQSRGRAGGAGLRLLAIRMVHLAIAYFAHCGLHITWDFFSQYSELYSLWETLFHTGYHGARPPAWPLGEVLGDREPDSRRRHRAPGAGARGEQEEGGGPGPRRRSARCVRFLSVAALVQTCSCSPSP